VYFSIKDQEVFKASRCFEFDRKFDLGEGGFTFYDYNYPTELPADLKGQFDMIVADPPYVTKETWEKYRLTIEYLLAPGGKILLSTLEDNADFILELTGCTKQTFKPYIPNLIYQFGFYSNYECSELLSQVNPEIPSRTPEEEE
jgi:methylase of polypeptide subunit release factors